MIAAVVSLVAAMLGQPRAASCPPGAWMDGIRPSGHYRCFVTGGTLEQLDPPHTLVAVGRVWCAPGETPAQIDHRRARCWRP